MPLHVRGEEVNKLAEEVRKALGAPTKTGVVSMALERVLTEQKYAALLRERLRRIQQRTLTLEGQS